MSNQLLVASQEGNLKSVKEIVENEKVNVNVFGDFGLTPLLMASSAGYTEIMRYLISRGADVNARAENHATSLHAIVLQGDLDGVALLVDSGADVNAKDDMGNTPLSLSKLKGFHYISNFLVKHGAKE